MTIHLKNWSMNGKYKKFWFLVMDIADRLSFVFYFFTKKDIKIGFTGSHFKNWSIDQKEYDSLKDGSLKKNFVKWLIEENKKQSGKDTSIV